MNLSFAVLLRLCWDTGAVDKEDLPDARLFLQEGRFQPVLFHPTGTIADG